MVDIVIKILVVSNFFLYFFMCSLHVEFTAKVTILIYIISH